MDRETAKAINLLYEASAELHREHEHLTRLLDDTHRLISALHDLVPAEPISLDEWRAS